MGLYNLNNIKKLNVKPPKTPGEVTYTKLWDNLYIWDDPRHLLIGTRRYIDESLRSRMRAASDVEWDKREMSQEILREAPDLDIRTLTWDSWYEESFKCKVWRLRAVVVYDWNNDINKEIR